MVSKQGGKKPYQHKVNTTSATSGAGTSYYSETQEFIPCFMWRLCCSRF